MQNIIDELQTLGARREQIGAELDAATVEVTRTQNAVIDGAPTSTAGEARNHREAIAETLRALDERIEAKREELKLAEGAERRRQELESLAVRTAEFEQSRAALMHNGKRIAEALDLLAEIGEELDSMAIDQQQIAADAARLGVPCSLPLALTVKRDLIELIGDEWTRIAIAQMIDDQSQRRFHQRNEEFKSAMDAKYAADTPAMESVEADKRAPVA
jgi:hypothetical protein